MFPVSSVVESDPNETVASDSFAASEIAPA